MNLIINFIMKLIVVSILCSDHFLHQWVQEVDSKNPDAVLLLVATKKDLVDAGKIKSVVEPDDAKEFADSKSKSIVAIKIY